ncbi:PIG-L deacetylase family protein [Teichococcus aestuarii]|uniref:PIG-L family deacetylase n=1 Tax=Teichococcus aestuarii TaxID=568898 RepID=A0A2U1V2Q2_9PROT|nr:PIG-L family deacetylase [Pseudoroseomonas aestuarii]PWC28164.1 PIG-L family deacetylase [Pseudoroseomonas aestuarii]
MAVTADAFFHAAEALPFAALDEILAPGGLLVLAPHPDDESLGCGGLIALAARQARPVCVAFISDGAASHPGSRDYPPEALRALRESEALGALALLGLPPGMVRFLHLPDAAVPHEGMRFLAAVERLSGLVRCIGAGTVLASWGHDPHCDHQATHAMAAALRRRHPGLRHLAYPVWGHTLPPETEIGMAPRGARLAIGSMLPHKRAAIRAHRSQLGEVILDDPQGFVLDASMLARFDRPYEIVLEVEPEA